MVIAEQVQHSVANQECAFAFFRVSVFLCLPLYGRYGNYDITQKQERGGFLCSARRKGSPAIRKIVERKGKHIGNTVDFAVVPVDFPNGGIIRKQNIDLCSPDSRVRAGGTNFSSAGCGADAFNDAPGDFAVFFLLGPVRKSAFFKTYGALK